MTHQVPSITFKSRVRDERQPVRVVVRGSADGWDDGGRPVRGGILACVGAALVRPRGERRAGAYGQLGGPVRIVERIVECLLNLDF